MYRRLHWNSDRAKQFRSQWRMLHVKTAYTVYIRWCEYLYIHICIGFTWFSYWCSPGGCTNFDDLGRPGFQHSKTTAPTSPQLLPTARLTGGAALCSHLPRPTDRQSCEESRWRLKGFFVHPQIYPQMGKFGWFGIPSILKYLFIYYIFWSSLIRISYII